MQLYFLSYPLLKIQFQGMLTKMELLILNLEGTSCNTLAH